MAKVSGKGKSFRSAGSGQFVTKSFAGKHPSTTVGETRGGSTGGTHRRAKSGEFVSAAYAAKHSETRVQDNKLEQIEKSIAVLSD